MLTGDQMALYEKDMYEAARESYREKPTMYQNIYSIPKKKPTGGGDKSTQILGASELDEHETENQDIKFDSPVLGWQFYVVYKTFSKGVPFSKNAVEDTVKLGNLLKDYANTWGRQVRVTKETWASRPFNRGGFTDGDSIFNGTWGEETDGSGNLAYDSFPVFNLTGNARSTKGGGTYYNAVASTTLTPDNFETLYNLMTATNNKDERDQLVENDCDTLLTKDGADHIKARIILKSTHMPGGQLNDINPYLDLVSPMKWAYLDTGPWYVGKAKHPDWQFHDRQKPEIRFYRREENRGYRATIDVRIGIMIKNWRAWHQANGTYTANTN